MLIKVILFCFGSDKTGRIINNIYNRCFKNLFLSLMSAAFFSDLDFGRILFIKSPHSDLYF